MDIALYTLRAIAEVIITPPSVFVLIVLGVILYGRNKKTVVMQKMIIGEKINSPLELTLSQIVVGIFAGAIGSLIMTYLGVVFENEAAILVLFMLSIILTVFGNRFICFAYSGAILGLISLLLQIIPAGAGFDLSKVQYLKVDIVMLVSLIAILHIVEGIMVMFDGSRGAIPVFTNKGDSIIGGFALKRNWILPIALLLLIKNPDTIAGPSTPMPDWWPLIKSQSINILKDAAVGLTAFFGMLGYNSITFTKSKEKKALTSGVFILLYGVILLGVAQLAKINLIMQLLVIVFTPAAHEFMLRIQSYTEVKGEPKFISNEEGIMVLEVAPKSPAYEMGIRSGDMLIEVNNKRIISEEDIFTALGEITSFIWFKIKRVTGKLEEVNYNQMNKSKRLGIVFVPRHIPKESVMMKFGGDDFNSVLEKVKDKHKDDE
ncbi:MAG: PDZ domain-containing protein [Bacillota bacterium]|nr:PDZ domain-containing protein [Bacillota bacterium]